MGEKHLEENFNVFQFRRCPHFIWGKIRVVHVKVHIVMMPLIPKWVELENLFDRDWDIIEWPDTEDLRNLPKEKSTRLAATATAAPLDDPPGTLEGDAGFVGEP